MDSWSHIEFVDICNNGFYFNEKGCEYDIDSDDFQKSEKKPCGYLIQSEDNKCLLLDDRSSLKACDISKPLELGCKFFLQMYNDSTLTSPGRAVILYSNKNNKKMVLCCNEKNEIYPEEMDLPRHIPGSTHKAVFYLRSLSSRNMYTFQSSVYLDRFLVFEPDENNPSMKKLVLLSKPHDEVDDSCKVRLIQMQ